MSKVVMAWPPCSSPKGTPTHAQNRQYQHFQDPTYIYPVIPAIFCSMLTSEVGTHVVWCDCIAEDETEENFAKFIKDFQPDYMVFEANTLLFKRICKVINDIKKAQPSIKIILCGEHLTARPAEVKEKCKADYFIEGGKWYYEAYRIIKDRKWHKELPKIDRVVSCWWLYSENNGNYKHTPATYMMASQDCWWRPGCNFCTWDKYHPEYEVREVEEYLDEVRILIQMGFREFFDDSGTFPVGEWLQKFCAGMKKRGYHEKISWGCNMRFGALRPEDFKMMAEAGCRFILWGFESTNQATLDRLNKGFQTKDVSKDLIASRLAGIWNHITVMVGYPWETLEDEKRTYSMVRWLLLNDWASSCQATIFMPYPGTKLFDELKKDGQIATEDWDKWDMTEEVVYLRYPFKEALRLQRAYYRISYHPKFIWNKISKIKNAEDFKFYWRILKKVFNRFGMVHSD